MGDLTKNFSISEVRCPCPKCMALEHPDLPAMGAMVKLQALRDQLMGDPIVLSCAIRCAAHNAEKGGASDSRHLPQYGDAFDIVCNDSNFRYRLVAAAIKSNFRFIEVCDAHIHVDDRPSICKLITGADH